jgi:hypothetical protein
VIAGMPVESVQRVLAGVVIGLFVVSTVGRVLKFAVYWDFAYTFVESFWLDAQLGIPRIFAAALLAVVAVIASMNAVAARQRGRSWMPWCVIAGLFVFACVEKVSGFHGRYGDRFSELLRSGDPAAWVAVVAGLATLVVLAVWLGRFARTLPVKAWKRILLASGLLLVASVVLELAASKVTDVNDTAAIIRYFIFASLEETLEMVSTLVFMSAFLLVLGDLSADNGCRVPPLGR